MRPRLTVPGLGRIHQAQGDLLFALANFHGPLAHLAFQLVLGQQTFPGGLQKALGPRVSLPQELDQQDPTLPQTDGRSFQGQFRPVVTFFDPGP